MITAFKIISAIFAVFALCTFGLTAVTIGASIYNFPELQNEIRAKIKEERPKLLVERPTDISNNLRSLWASHTVDQDMTIFFLTRGGLAFTFSILALLLWSIALQIQIFALATKRKTEQGAAANP